MSLQHELGDAGEQRGLAYVDLAAADSVVELRKHRVDLRGSFYGGMSELRRDTGCFGGLAVGYGVLTAESGVVGRHGLAAAAVAGVEMGTAFSSAVRLV